MEEIQADRTPELDTVVRAYAADNLQREGVVTGWVLFVGTQRFDEDGAMLFAYDYSIAPDSNLFASVGLVEVGYNQMKSALIDNGQSRSGGEE